MRSVLCAVVSGMGPAHLNLLQRIFGVRHQRFGTLKAGHMFRLFHLALVAAVVVLGAIGVSRLSYNVEILDLLPKGYGWSRWNEVVSEGL